MKLLLFFTLSIFLFGTANATTTPGLNYSYYEGTWNSLPNFNSLTPLKTGLINNVDLNPRNKDKQFGFLWTGYITIPAAGSYTFETTSDDGSKLYIGNYNHSTPALVNNDGLHGNQLRKGTISLNAGTYPIAITFFENDGDEIMAVYWSSNTGIARQKIPDNVFQADVVTNPVPDPGMTAGINYSYYEGTWNSLPDFNAITPVKKGVGSNVSLSHRNRDKQFGFKWEAYINIPASGTYTFETMSDDGSKLYIDEYGYTKTPLINNDGLHANQLRTGTITLNAGIYPITITFFENDGGETMEVYWSSNTGIARQKIPDNAFKIDSVTPEPDPSQLTGLNYSYYEGTWSALPDFNSLTPAKKGVSNNVDLTPRNRNNQFGFLWEGYINIPAAGSYKFETNSDDGSKIYIGEYDYSRSPLVNNDGLHANQVRTGTITLNAGLYPIAITFFENDGGETMEIYWSSNTGIARQKIPDNVFKADTVRIPVDPIETGGLTGNINYYFSATNGDDSRSSTQAQNPSTPWKTLTKLNSFFPNLTAGNAVLFNRGEIFDGSIAVSKSGTSNLPIIFSSYGTGTKPVINGLVTLSNWTSLGNNVWESNCPSTSYVNMVIYDGVVKAMGRYPNISEPNKGFLVLEAHNGNTRITDYQLPGSPNWTGAEVVIRKNNWCLDRGLITSHSGNSISYNSPTTHEALNGYGYFLQNSPLTLDQAGEWYFDPSRKKLKIYSITNPNSITIKASVIDNLASVNNKSHIIFDNISFQGADVNALLIEGSQDIRVQNCDVNFSGTQAISGINASSIVIENTSFNNTNNDVIEFYNSSNSTIKNNSIKNTGLLPGMGLSNNQQYEAIFIEGANNLIEGNQIINTGYSAITFNGEGAVIKNNFVDNFCLTLEDGGGVYSWGEMDKYNRKIIGNIILNGIGAHEGTPYPFSTGANGIMIDDRTANIEMTNNTIANCSRTGIILHNSTDMTLKGNTLFNNRIQLSMVQDNIAPDVPIRNMVSTNNIIFSKIASQYILETGSLTNDFASFGSIDNNYYVRPADENGIIYASYKDASGNPMLTHFDLEGWKGQYGLDRNSLKSPVKIPSYLVNRIVGGNRFSNGSFNSNTNGAFCISSPGACTASWNSGGKLDGGSLQISFDASGGATNDVGTYVNVGTVEAGKKYIIRFSLLGGKVGKTLKGFMLQDGGSYGRLSETKYFELTTTRTEHEFLFTPGVSESVILAFELKGTDCPFWMDNFQVLEADISATNPDDYIRFEYNATSSAKTVSLNGAYVDAKNKLYENNVSLQPYTSVVLLKQPSATQESPTGLWNNKAQEADLFVSDAEALKITVGPNPASEKVHISVNAPQGSKKSIVTIQSVSGVRIKTIPLTSSNQSITVDISSWNSGVYVINFINDGHSVNKKFVKQ